MKISDLIRALKNIKADVGDCEVAIMDADGQRHFITEMCLDIHEDENGFQATIDSFDAAEDEAPL